MMMIDGHDEFSMGTDPKSLGKDGVEGLAMIVREVLDEAMGKARRGEGSGGGRGLSEEQVEELVERVGEAIVEHGEVAKREGWR